MSIEGIERVPPQNIEAEMSVLGAMLLDKEAIPQAIEILKEDYFYQEKHRRIFSAIVSLFEQGKAVDLITLKEELKKRKWLKEVGGVSYLTTLTNVVPSSANIEEYAHIVKEKALLRGLISASTQIIKESYDSSQDPDLLLDRAERAIFNVVQYRVESKVFSFNQLIKDSIETIDRLYQNKANITGIPSGFRELDVMTAGLQPSDLIIIAGRPSMGKSAFACSIAESVGLVHKFPLVFFSLEMSRQQLVQRMLCSCARIDAHKVRTGFLSHSDWPVLINAASKLSEAPIFVDDTPGISVLELRAKARRLKARYNIQMVIVDYLQLMQGPAKAENRQQEISEISRSLKALARELNIPVIAISQLSRAVEARTSHRPQLSDLRESGAIEQDADLVLLLLREEYYNPTEENKGIAEVIIGKQRNGPVGSIKLAFIKEYARFEDLSLREEIEEKE
ncbi:MAG: replicative DNA helicase [Candidatus Omnitrophota bacterium]|nr:MAG: replicative DNA helicase [Candidatus Omnitrophota bacterium]